MWQLVVWTFLSQLNHLFSLCMHAFSSWLYPLAIWLWQYTRSFQRLLAHKLSLLPFSSRGWTVMSSRCSLFINVSPFALLASTLLILRLQSTTIILFRFFFVIVFLYRKGTAAECPNALRLLKSLLLLFLLLCYALFNGFLSRGWVGEVGLYHFLLDGVIVDRKSKQKYGG